MPRPPSPTAAARPKNKKQKPLVAAPAVAAARSVWGFRPTRQIKVVHLMNGFLRGLNGEVVADVSALCQLIASLRGLSQREARDIILDATFQATAELSGANGLGPAATEYAVNELRKALDSVLNQDGAFYVRENNSTLTLTHAQHLTADLSDSQAGEFLAQVLELVPGQPAAQVLRAKLRETAGDVIYQLTAPLLVPALPIPAAPTLGLETAALKARVVASCVLPAWQASFTTLTAHAAYLDKPALFQRAGLLAGLGLWLHLHHGPRAAGEAAACPPLLLCATRHHPDVRQASRFALAQARQRLHRTFRQALAQEYQKSGIQRYTPEQLRAWLPQQANTNKPTEQARCLDDFELELAAGQPPFAAAMQALTEPALRYAGSISPEECAAQMGRRLGLEWPRGQGGGERYLMPVAAVYDALVPALLGPEQAPVPAEVFWRKAYQQFGLVCGAVLPDDLDHLAAVGARGSLTARHLQDNARNVHHELTQLGYARTYADEVTLISANW